MNRYGAGAHPPDAIFCDGKVVTVGATGTAAAFAVTGGPFSAVSPANRF